jgi:hypothetical protein
MSTHTFKTLGFAQRSLRGPRAGRAALVAVAAWVGALTTDCTRPRTQLIVRAETDLPQGPTGMTSVLLEVVGTSTGARTGPLEVMIGPGATMLPANLLSLTSSGTNNAVTLTLVGRDASGRALARQVRETRFLPGTTGWVTLELAGGCDATRAAACEVRGQTCGFSGCVAVARPASPIEPASPDAGMDGGLQDGGTDATPDAGMDGGLADGGIDATPDDAGPDALPPLMCMAPAADCDGVRANGCEQNLSTSAAHCGRCGAMCVGGPNATPLCNSGVCDVQCAAGFGDCDRDMRSCESNLSTNASHCGRCGVGCAGTTDALGVCAAGRCMTTPCPTGMGNCDRNPTNSCEVNLGTSEFHCGACGNRCSPGVRCEAGRCADQRVLQMSAGGNETGASTCGVRTDAMGRDALVCWGRSFVMDATVHAEPTAGPAIPAGVTVDPANGLAIAGATFALQVTGMVPVVWTAGSAALGLLGDGTARDRTTFDRAMMPAGMGRVTLLAGGPANLCASDGTIVACWGQGTQGIAGGAAPFPATQATPQIITLEPAPPGGDAGMSPVTIDELSVGGSFACARTGSLAAGPVLCWGSTDASAFSDGTMTESRGVARPVPVRLMDETRLTSLAVGGGHACVTGTSARVYCWGANGSRQVGDTAAAFRSPTASAITTVETDGTAVMVVAGRAHTCALSVSGAARRVTCWGDNGRGQLGRGSGPFSASGRVLLSPGVELTQVLRITAGPDHTCAVRMDRSVVCWGAGTGGQLGDGTRMDRPFATPIGRLP